MNFRTNSDKIFDFINYVLLTLALITIVYPLYFLVINSISDTSVINSVNVWFFPKKFSFIAYKEVFKYPRIYSGFLNSMFYSVSAAALSVIMTMFGGYVLSRKVLVGKGIIMFLLVLTMYFSGGLVPTYFVYKALHMYNTVWVMIIPGAVSAWNIIIARTFITSTIPDELYEAAVMDGCSHSWFLFKIVFPLSSSLMTVIGLFSFVGHWNSYFAALVYISDQKLYPLQLILREILIQNNYDGMTITDYEGHRTAQQMAELLKYALIVVASIPPLLLYPLLQKHFVKGMMIGSLKG